MKYFLPFILLLTLPALGQTKPCAEECGKTCGTPSSCCPAKMSRCSSVQLERGGMPSSAYSSKGAPRLH